MNNKARTQTAPPPINRLTGKPFDFAARNILSTQFNMGPLRATCWAMLAALAPSLLVIGMSATSEMPALPLARFAMLSFPPAAFGICFMLTRQCFSCVRSIGYLSRRLMKAAALTDEGSYKQSLLDTNELVEGTLGSEINRFIHFVCWSGISFGLFLAIATNFVGITLTSYADIVAYETLIDQASGTNGTLVIPDSLRRQKNINAFSFKETVLFGLSVLTLVMAAIKVFRSIDHVLEEHYEQSSLPITNQKDSDVSTDCPLVSTTEEHPPQPQSLFSSGNGKPEKGSSVPITA